MAEKPERFIPTFGRKPNRPFELDTMKKSRVEAKQRHLVDIKEIRRARFAERRKEKRQHQIARLRAKLHLCDHAKCASLDPGAMKWQYCHNHHWNLTHCSHRCKSPTAQSLSE